MVSSSHVTTVDEKQMVCLFSQLANKSRVGQNISKNLQNDPNKCSQATACRENNGKIHIHHDIQ